MPRHINVHRRNRPTFAEAEALVREAELVLFLTPKARRCLEKLRVAVLESRNRTPRKVPAETIRRLREWKRRTAAAAATPETQEAT